MCFPCFPGFAVVKESGVLNKTFRCHILSMGEPHEGYPGMLLSPSLKLDSRILQTSMVLEKMCIGNPSFYSLCFPKTQGVLPKIYSFDQFCEEVLC